MKRCGACDRLRVNEVWALLGDLEEEDAMHVLTRLFTMYEEQARSDSADKGNNIFFRNLATAITQASECNLNRR